MKEITEMSVKELKNLKSEIEKELVKRSVCVWSLKEEEKKVKEEKNWEGEKYIS